MSNRNRLDKPNTKPSYGILIALGIVLIGVITSLVIRQSGGAPMVAFLLMVIFNLGGAVILDVSNRSLPKVTGAMLLLCLLMALPLLWVPDGTAYLRENPLTFGAILLIAAYLPNISGRTWALYLLAFIMGLLHIEISLT